MLFRSTKKASLVEEKKIDFESSMQRLEEIVAALEKGKVGLDESMKLYEEAISLARDCNIALEDAEQKVKIVKITPDGVMLESFGGGDND